MFGKFNIFGGNKSEEVPANESNKPLVNTEYKKDPLSNENPYGNYAEKIETDEMGVAKPHDVHMAKNRAIMEEKADNENTPEEVDLAA